MASVLTRVFFCREVKSAPVKMIPKWCCVCTRFLLSDLVHLSVTPFEAEPGKTRSQNAFLWQSRVDSCSRSCRFANISQHVFRDMIRVDATCTWHGIKVGTLGIRNGITSTWTQTRHATVVTSQDFRSVSLVDFQSISQIPSCGHDILPTP